MTERYAERPAFIDPLPTVTGGEIGEAPIPAWFKAVALLIVAATAWALFAFWSGPKPGWGGGIDAGRTDSPASDAGDAEDTEPAHSE